LPAKRPAQARTLRDHVQFRFSPRWLGSGVVFGTLIALAVRRWGRAAALLTALGGASAAAYATLVEPRRPVLERVSLSLPRLPRGLEGLRIGHLSDFHLGFPHSRTNVQWAVQQMQHEQPELIVITGDFVNAGSAIADSPDLLRNLHAPLGIYAITGNHDMWEGSGELRSHLEPLGIEFLLNRSKRLQWHGEPFWIAGIDDVWYGEADVDAALRHIPPDAFTLFLCHAPDFADHVAHHPIDLQLSGHTHGGQMCLPWLDWCCLPLYGLRYISGLYHVGRMHLYVSRGLGGLPWRLNCPPEATILTLRRG
jgi:hypothetical protein